MTHTDTASTSIAPIQARPDTLLAAPGHTWKLFAIVAILTVLGIMNASHQLTARQAPDPAQIIKTDLFMIGMLWFWVYFVYKGMRAHGRSIREFFGPAPFAPAALLADAAYGVLAIALIYACSRGLDLVAPESAGTANNPLHTSTPQGLLAIVVWVCLSLSAGICEEIVFRGYLQRQLAALTGKVVLAILIQGAVFGIGHAYEGIGAVVHIVAHGLVLGLLAWWRGTIRAGIVEHAGWDILVGFGLL